MLTLGEVVGLLQVVHQRVAPCHAVISSEKHRNSSLARIGNKDVQLIVVPVLVVGVDVRRQLHDIDPYQPKLVALESVVARVEDIRAEEAVRGGCSWNQTLRWPKHLTAVSLESRVTPCHLLSLGIRSHFW